MVHKALEEMIKQSSFCLVTPGILVEETRIRLAITMPVILYKTDQHLTKTFSNGTSELRLACVLRTDVEGHCCMGHIIHVIS